MGTMRFMSCPQGSRGHTKIFSFDSSPGRAISQALGDLEEKSYTAELKEEREGEKIYEVSMRRKETESSPGPHPLKKVGSIRYRPTF